MGNLNYHHKPKVTLPDFSGLIKALIRYAPTAQLRYRSLIHVQTGRQMPLCHQGCDLLLMDGRKLLPGQSILHLRFQGLFVFRNNFNDISIFFKFFWGSVNSTSSNYWFYNVLFFCDG